MLQESLKLIGTIVLFDRDYGIFFFQDFKGYSSLIDDAEWLLERTPQRSWGFMIRPVASGERCGLWIGEYGPHVNQIIREELLFDEGSSALGRMLFDYMNHKVSERKIRRKMTLDFCKKKLCSSAIIQGFKYYACPVERFYKSCPHVERIYRSLKGKYVRGSRVHYSLVADVIFSVKQCEDILICPLLASSNAFEAIINLNRALRYRKIGEIKIADRNMVEIS
ncbi:MAG: hypothetical protein QXR06_04300 [Candidatus Bathyarchaeia archaeon]|nr:hypothetical protein [Candidatus Bathyarchaeota archaeon]